MSASQYHGHVSLAECLFRLLSIGSLPNLYIYGARPRSTEYPDMSRREWTCLTTRNVTASASCTVLLHSRRNESSDDGPIPRLRCCYHQHDVNGHQYRLEDDDDEWSIWLCFIFDGLHTWRIAFNLTGTLRTPRLQSRCCWAVSNWEQILYMDQDSARQPRLN